MGIFDADNTVEQAPAAKARARATETAAAAPATDREVTVGDVLGATYRQQRAAAQTLAERVMPSKPQAAPTEEDAVAKRHGLYTVDRGNVRTYFADYQQKQEVMRAEPARIRTKQDDQQTVSAVLDLAQERGWETLRLRGTEDFRREAWVQAQVRGIATEGYRPTQTDQQELGRRQATLKPAAAAENAPAAAPAVATKAARPEQAWSETEVAGDTARAADATKQKAAQAPARQAKAQSGPKQKVTAVEAATAAAPNTSHSQQTKAEQPIYAPRAPEADTLRLYYGHSRGNSGVAEDGSVTFTTNAAVAGKSEKVFFVDVPNTPESLSRFKVDAAKQEYTTQDMGIFSAITQVGRKAESGAAWSAVEAVGEKARAADAASQGAGQQQAKRQEMAQAAA